MKLINVGGLTWLFLAALSISAGVGIKHGIDAGLIVLGTSFFLMAFIRGIMWLEGVVK